MNDIIRFNGWKTVIECVSIVTFVILLVFLSEKFSLIRNLTAVI